jgi:hypothetical protein
MERLEAGLARIRFIRLHLRKLMVSVDVYDIEKTVFYNSSRKSEMTLAWKR